MGADRVRYHASAPVRLDLAGGWTDVAPFAEREGGVVVNAAIDLRAHAELTLGGAEYRLEAEDLGESARLLPGDLVRSGRLDLQKAALRRSGIGPCTLRTWSEAPSGSGLGSSGALDVALVAVLDAAQGKHRTREDLAEEAFQVEAVEAELPGGRQDQYAAALGGFHRLRFGSGSVAAEPLRLDSAFLAELATRIVVCYTGESRVSSKTIARVMSGYERGDAGIVGALRRMLEVAEAMAEALCSADILQTGRLLSLNWKLQQQLDPAMRSEPMARLEAAMEEAGTLGGKAVGAGAGGSMIFLRSGDATSARHAAEAAGARLIGFRWSSDGVLLQ